jgi:AraC family transcriptional regulator, transcriptional activator of pobA
MRATCCQVPVFGIQNFDYGSVIKSTDFHFAPMQSLMATLPYPHRHDFFHIIWVERGSGHHVIDEVKYEVRPRALFFMSPGQIHDFVLSDDTEGYTISFSAEFFVLQLQNKNVLAQIPIYDHRRQVQAIYPQGALADDIRDIIEAIRKEYEEEQFRAQDMIRSFLFVLLVKASRIALPENGIDAGNRAQLLFRRFKELMEEHFATIQQPGEYARMLRTTERALNDAARRCGGGTAANLIRERVILEAKRLLAHSGAQVAQVGMQLGFEDAAYFSRCFKKHTGRTPVEFRQSIARLTE